MSPSDIARVVIEGVLYDSFKFVFGPLIVTAAIGLILNKLFHKLQEFREMLIYGVSAFCAILVVFYVVGSKSQQPQFIGGIQHIITGAAGDHDTVAIVTMSIMNAGNMQSIIKNIAVEAAINGVKYQAAFGNMPKQFTFTLPDLGTSSPQSLTYHSEDDLLLKALLPVQGGGLAAGTLYVVFRNVNPEAFKAGADFTVTYEDVMSHTYAATGKTTAQFMSVGVVPGLHTEMVCPLRMENFRRHPIDIAVMF